MENKLKILYDRLDFFADLYRGENKKNPCDFDKLIKINKEINKICEEIKIIKG